MKKRIINKSQILKYVIPFYIKGFYENQVTGYTLSPIQIDCNNWFEEYKNKILSSIGKSYLPICRLSDGEYLFICGQQPQLGNNIFMSAVHYLIFKINQFFSDGSINASTFGVSSGNYTKLERISNLDIYLRNLLKISQDGILALHLTYSKKPFQERYHKKLASIFKAKNIIIACNNYYPFYFVYAFFSTKEFYETIAGKRILLITGSTKDKINIVESYFRNLNVKYIHSYEISSNKSLFDTINVSFLINYHFDICFIAAGIGKPNIIVQLEKLNCPCIDVGFMFEVWADQNLAYSRSWCSPNFK